MFALPATLLLLVTDYIKPQEYFALLRRLPLLYLFTGLAMVGFAVDVRLEVARLRAAPQLVWVLAFSAWAMLTTAIKAPDTLATELLFFVQISLFLIFGHALQSFRSLQIVIAT